MKIFRVLLLCAALVAAGVSAKAATTTAENKKAKTETVVFDVSLHCEACKSKIIKNMMWDKGVKNLTFDLEKKQVAIKYNPRKTGKDKLKKVLENLGYTVSEAEPEAAAAPAPKE